MKDKLPTKEQAISNFIRNVDKDDAHTDVTITAYELLEGTDDFPIILDGSMFIDCLIGYFESFEDYEMCSNLLKNKEDIQKRLVPIDKFCTKNHEVMRNFRSKRNG